MKLSVGILYLVISGYSGYWAGYKILKQIDGASQSFWYVDLFFGALILIIGALLRWTRWQKQTSWLPVMGSGLIVTYYVGAAVVTVRRHLAGNFASRVSDLGITLLPVLLVLVCLSAAVFEKFLPELSEPPARAAGNARDLQT